MINDFIDLPIQLGFDVATSLTIIGSLTYFVYTTKQRIDEERTQRFDKNARVVAAEQLKESIKELSKIFVNEVVDSGERTKSLSGYKNGQGEDLLSAMSQRLGRDGAFEKTKSELSYFNEKVGKFYELIQTHRYSVIPVLDSIEENSDLVRILKRNIASVADEYNKHNRVEHLLHELKGLHELILDIMKDNDLKGFEEILDNDELERKLLTRAASIVYDEHYFKWTWSFLPDGKEDLFLHEIQTTSSLSEMSEEMRGVFLNCCFAISKSLLDDSKRECSKAVVVGISKQQESAKVCKEILVTLSAILKYLLAKDGSHQSIESLISDYRGSDYFSLDEEIR
ncbi:hypothetical protein RSO68_08445 [Halomonas saccharevitans]|uniref:Uncharacterized protein n=1 Tax=Halomonas saccharevitans TaxID=416872 RepID=A0ABU3NE90_9GAMM|nr:hypothetical protein [Halomonas saccharevitans]MDT8879496.1 hypothetical protein [Halomonas saccharevitans]